MQNVLMTALPNLSILQWIGVGIGFVFAIFIFVVIWKSVTIAKSDEIITLDRMYVGKSMPDGRTIALRDEIGKQARILGPGPHFLPPYYKTQKESLSESRKPRSVLLRHAAVNQWSLASISPLRLTAWTSRMEKRS